MSRGQTNIRVERTRDSQEIQMKFALEPQRVEKQQTARFAWYPVVARDKNQKRWIVWLRTVYLRVANENGHWEYVL
jgi:hypothetical protein